MLDIEFDIRYSTFDLNVGLSNLIFDIRHSKFECRDIEFDIRYSTFNLNVGFSLIYQTKFDIQI